MDRLRWKFCYPVTINYHRGNDANSPIEHSVVVENIGYASTSETVLLRYGQPYFVQVIDASGQYSYDYGTINYAPDVLYHTDICGLQRLSANLEPFLTCQPLKVEWKDETTNTILHTNDNVTGTSTTLPDPVPYNHNYSLTLRTQDGTLIHTWNWSPSWSPIGHNNSIRSCRGYKMMRNFRNISESCFPLKIEWVVKDTQEVVEERIYNKPIYFYSPRLQHGVEYEARLKTMDDRVLYTYQEYNTSNPNSFDIKMYAYDANPNQKDYGRLRFYFNNNWSHYWDNLKVEVIDPDGRTILLDDYTHLAAVHNPDKSKTDQQIYYFEKYLGAAHFKPGTYTVNVYCDGELIKTHQYEHRGFWNTKDLSYTYRNTCSGINILPEAKVTWLGEEVAASQTYFQIIAGPSENYEKRVLSKGNELMVGQPGRYLIAVKVYNSSSAGNIDTIVAHVGSNPIILSSAHTLAYACGDNVTDVGHIFVKATGGIAPYTYELWTADNSTNTQQTPEIDPVTGVAHWRYGRVGDKFVVHVRDACGTNFEQTLTVNDLTRLNIASTPDKLTCAGESVILRCLPLNRYEWYDPQGVLFSREQNPRLTNVKRNMSGIYRVKAFPEGCGTEIEGYVNVVIEPCWAPVNPNLMHRVGSLHQSVPD